MPKGRRKSHSKRSLIYNAYLLVIFILIKIGRIPISIVYQLWFIDYRLKKARLLKLSYSIIHIQYSSLPYIPKRNLILISALLVFFAYTLLLIQFSSLIPSPSKLSETTHPLTTEFYDRNGILLYRLYEGRNRTLVNLSDLPLDLIRATVAAEDKNFYKHFGIDLEAITRAVYHNLKYDDLQGASTITQQLVKTSLLTPEKTYSRKIKEIILSLMTERIYSKDEILQMYFNEAPYGGPAWGIETAALTYFGKHAKELNLSESAYLAGLPASPTIFSPYGTNPNLAIIRKNFILDRMVEENYITFEQSKSAKSEQLNIKPPIANIEAPHFVMYIKDLLSRKYGAKFVSQGGLKIYTTLDLNLQEKIQEIRSEEVEKLKNLNVQNGAAMLTDAKTGQILAMIGSKDYYNSKFGNFNAALSLRQPGSSIKVVTYLEACKQGFTPGNTILDSPVSFPDGDKKYSPVHYDGRFHGPVSIRTALGSSYNIPAVKMLATVGLENMIQTAESLGISTFQDINRYGFSLTLGGGEVKMIDMMSVYGVLSQNGEKNYPTGILKITDSSGNIIEEYQKTGKKVIQPEIAYLITSILSDNGARAPAFGYNSLLNIPSHSVAVKTGTSDNKRDNWTFSYTPEFVVGVWVGNNDNSPMNPSLISGTTGAAPIWNKIMTYILKNNEPIAFERPEGIVEVKVDGRNDLAISGNAPKRLVKIKREEDKLIFADQFSSFAT